MPDFNIELDRVLVREGVYSDEKIDRGGETFYGIARRMRPTWPGWARFDLLRASGALDGMIKSGNMRATMKDLYATDPALASDVRDLYRTAYWESCGAASLSDGPEFQTLAGEMFDCAVNQGPQTAVICVQKALNKLNRNQKNFSNLVHDGSLGRKSLAALQFLFDKGDFQFVIGLYRHFRTERYVSLCDRSEDQEINLRSWLRRTWGNKPV